MNIDAITLKAINKTGHFSKNTPHVPLVYKYAMEYIRPFDSVLDYGSGPMAVWSEWLRKQINHLIDINVRSHEVGLNFNEDIHFNRALNFKYHMVLVSNVFNVLPTKDLIIDTLLEVSSLCLRAWEGKQWVSYLSGKIIFNYTSSPRKSKVNVFEFYDLAKKYIGNNITLLNDKENSPVFLYKG